MRNPKVSIEKAQGKGLLYPCPKCPMADDMWYTHFSAPYGCCHYDSLQGSQYYHQEPCSPCLAAGQTADKGKGCKVRVKLAGNGLHNIGILYKHLVCLCWERGANN